jgi:hypothetical protein
VSESRPVISVVAEAIASGGRAVGRPLLTLAETLVRFVRLKKLAEDFADVNAGLRSRDHSETTQSDAHAQMTVSEATDAANRVADQLRERAAKNRKLEAEARLLEAQAEDVAAGAAQKLAHARLEQERAKQVALATEHLEERLRGLKAKDGSLLVDVERLQQLLSESAGDEQVHRRTIRAVGTAAGTSSVSAQGATIVGAGYTQSPIDELTQRVLGVVWSGFPTAETIAEELRVPSDEVFVALKTLEREGLVALDPSGVWHGIRRVPDEWVRHTSGVTGPEVGPRGSS